MRWCGMVLRGGWFALMTLGAVLITIGSLVYFESGTIAPFVLEKMPLRLERLWLWALKVHVAAALITFPACLLLMTRAVQRRRVWHRNLGRVTGGLVIVALVPSGLILSAEAKGGMGVTLGFVLSALIVSVAMTRGVLAARRGNLMGHAHAMRHVFAQMSVAITSRAMLVGFDALRFDPDLSYVLALWVPVLVSALVAEAISPRPYFQVVPAAHFKRS